jgi:TonB family protein
MENDVMYCAACNANFSQKFGFCPTCGAKLIGIEKLQASNPPAVSSQPKIIQPESGYRITIVREKNVRERNLLFLGAIMLLTAVFASGVVYSIFNKVLDVAAVETDDLYAFVADIDPLTMEPVEEVKKDKKNDGGGGGGRNDKNPVQKGRLATQTTDPLFSPSKDYTQMTDPELKIRAATLGTKKAPLTNEPYGLPKGSAFPSDGQGCCGGQGDNGRGRGQGGDEGDGAGPGKKGGSGNRGIGLIGGNNIEDDKQPPPEVKNRITQGVNIISKPRASYTDAAREKLVQGKVVLKVTFLASGEIGSIVTVAGLPGGLTEQAIAAARAIKFEPAKVNGVAVSITKTIEYTFSIF